MTDTTELATFRLETREWLRLNCPHSMRGKFGVADEYWGGRNARFITSEQQLWFERMAAKGWTVPTGQESTEAVDLALPRPVYLSKSFGD